MKHNEFQSYTLGEMEDTIEEYESLYSKLQDMAKETKYIDIEFLQDCLADEFLADINEMKDIIAEAENETLPSRSEMLQDYINDRLKELR